MNNKVDKMEPKRDRALLSNAELLEWLDGYHKATAHRNASTDLDHELGFASILYQTCLQLFGEIWKLLKQDRKRPRALQARTRENLSRLVLWGDFLDHGRLDACLNRSTEIRDSVLEVFYDIGKMLIEAASKLISDTAISQGTYIKDLLKDLAILLEKVNSILSIEDVIDISSDSEESEREKAAIVPDIAFDKNMYLYVTCLMDLSPTLEHMANNSNLADEDPIIGPNGINFHVTESAKQHVLQVHHKFRSAPKELVKRLGEANWQRFVRIRTWMQKQEHELAQKDQETVAAKSVFAPLSKFHDSSVGSSIPTRSDSAASVDSHCSFLSTEADISAGRIRVPPTPEEVGKGLPFKCLICGHVQSQVKNRTDWKIHVFQDLQPYICTFDDCSSLLVTFPTRKLWSEHEFTEHRIYRFLKCHDCLEQFENEDLFVEHLRNYHGNRASGHQLTAIVSAAKTARPTAIESQNCPLCLQGGWQSQHDFTTHVARHMEDIAVACLFKDAGDEDKSSDGEDVVQRLSFPDFGFDTLQEQALNVQDGQQKENIADAGLLKDAKAEDKSSNSKDIVQQLSFPDLGFDIPRGQALNIQEDQQKKPTSPLSFEALKSFLRKHLPNDRIDLAASLVQETLEPLQSASSSGDINNIPAANSRSIMDDVKPSMRDGKLVYSCPYPGCEKYTLRRCELRKHVQRHKNPWACTFDRCRKSFGSKNDWKRHETKQHAQQECWRCEELQTNKSGRSVPTTDDNACMKLFCTEYLYLKHLTAQHNITDDNVTNKLCKSQRIGAKSRGQYWCGFCNKITKMKGTDIEGDNERYNHIDDHFMKDGYRIDRWKALNGRPSSADCPMKSDYATSSAASSYAESGVGESNGDDGAETTNEKSGDGFQCHLCPKRYKRAYGLRSHLKTHSNEHPFVCTVCGEAFIRQSDRKKHEVLHSRDDLAAKASLGQQASGVVGEDLQALMHEEGTSDRMLDWSA